MTHTIILALAFGAFVLPAAAQQPATSSSPSTSSQSQAGAMNPSSANIQQHMSQDLEKAGFTNVQIMPESFLVRAKNKDGQPVMMVINPDSVTSVTAVSAQGDKGSQSSGDASSNSSTKKN